MKKNLYSNWREDLREVVDTISSKPERDQKSEKEIKDKKVNNKVEINPVMKEEFKELGGVVLEFTELDEALRSREERMSRMMTDKDRKNQKKERELKAKADEIISTERALSKGRKNNIEKTYDTPSAEVRKLKPGQKKDTLAMNARKAMGEEFIDPEQGETPSGRTPLQNVSDHPKASVRRRAIKGMRKQMGKEYGGNWKSRSNDPVKEESEIDEKMNLKTADMGDVVKDFYKSDAPQFRGKSKKERREMAIAAKLTAERGGKKLGEESAVDLVTNMIRKQQGGTYSELKKKGKLPKPRTQTKPSSKKPTDMTTATDPRPGSRYRGD